jgi:hypothetical protein
MHLIVSLLEQACVRLAPIHIQRPHQEMTSGEDVLPARHATPWLAALAAQFVHLQRQSEAIRDHQ